MLGGNTVGVARGVTIVPVKVASRWRDPNPPFDANGNPKQKMSVSLLATARGLDWILQDVQSHNYKAVVNISLRLKLSQQSSYTCGAGGNCVAAIEYVVGKLIQNRIPVVASAGNNKYDVSNDAIARMGYSDLGNGPSGYGNGPYGSYHTITVGGTEHTGASTGYEDKAWMCDASRDQSPGTPFTSCSQNEGSNHGAAVSIWAPAWNVLAALGFNNSDYRPFGFASSGTSFAAPQVAGAVARILQKYPARSKTALEIWQELGNAAVNSYITDFSSEDAVTNNKLLYVSPGQ